jgi:hypothetical protein
VEVFRLFRAFKGSVNFWETNHDTKIKQSFSLIIYKINKERKFCLIFPSLFLKQAILKIGLGWKT